MGNTKDDHNNEDYDEDDHLQPYLQSQSLKPYVLEKHVNHFHMWWAAQEINMTINVFYLT